MTMPNQVGQGCSEIVIVADAMEMTERRRIAGRRRIVFVLGNACVAVLFYGFWLLGWWIRALEDLYDAASAFLPAVWFVGFFAASFLPLKSWIKKPVLSILISVGLAFGFSYLLYALISLSHLLLAPFLDPMF
jgi:hypothetical protein